MTITATMLNRVMTLLIRHNWVESMISIDKLASLIATRRCVLFAGSGLSVEYGGATWSQLITYLQEKFNYRSPLEKSFDIMEDLCIKFTTPTVYKKVQERFVGIKLGEPVVKLASLPWYSVFTTNYDTALEDALRENQELDILTIFTGGELDLDGIQSEIQCVKLMGSCNIDYGKEGQMVLSPGDYIKALEERARIFDRLERHAANRSFLFIGYSFEDDLFIDIIRKLKNLIGDPPQKFYALFKDTLPDSKVQLLKNMNVEIIVEDLQKFSIQLSERVKQLMKTDFSIRRILIGSDVVPIKTTRIPSFLKIYNPVFYPEMVIPVSAYSFLKGETSSFYPFEQKWDYKREETNKVVEAVVKKNTKEAKPSILSIEGDLGTGRTFILLSSIYRLMVEQRALCFSMPSYAETPIPSPEEMNEYILEVEKNCETVKCEKPKRIVFWAEFAPGLRILSKFTILASKCKYPVTLLYEDLKHASLINEFIPPDEHLSIPVKDDISQDKKEDLTRYILNTVRRHKFQEISKEEAINIIREEKEFFPIMYRLLDPTRQSIDKSIEKHYHEIINPDAKECLNICALSSSMGFPVPIVILQGALSDHFRKFFSIDAVFDIIEGHLKEFVKNYQDIRTNPLADIYHPITARAIIDLIDKRKINDYLVNIGRSCDLHSRIESEFVNRIFIDYGVNIPKGQYQPFNNDGLLRAFKELKKRQPARVIIHHYARLKKNIDVNDKEIIPLLHEALAEPPEIFALDEKKENVLTTLADTCWTQKKELLATKPRNDPEMKEIIALLLKARGSHGRNLPPYHVHAKILIEFAETKEDNEKLSILNEALEVIEQALNISGSNPDMYQEFISYKIKILSQMDFDKAKKLAEEILTKTGDGTGYYTLARIVNYEGKSDEETKAYLTKAIKADTCPIGAFTMMLGISLSEQFPDYKNLIQLVDHLEADGSYRDGWISAYNKGVIYFINERYKDAIKYFKISEMMAPPFLQRRVKVHWNDKSTGKRKKFAGTIKNLTTLEGFIYPHDIPNNGEDIYFSLGPQKYKTSLRSGLYCNFELGFSPKGPQAFDVRPYGTELE
jgi:tetratricopeptide (TPR) repeat protein